MRWVVAAMLVCACKEDRAPTPPPKPPAPAELRLFTEPEIAKLEADLMKRIDANAKRTCARPVLHGDARAGAARDDIVAFVEPQGELANCLHKFKDAEVGGKLSDLVEQRAPHLLEIDKDCGAEIEKAVLSIAAHEDACSPYQAGVRVDPPELFAPIRAAHIVGLRARLRAEAGDVSGALWLIADALRAYGDVGRGNVGLVPVMVANASADILLRHVETILEKPIAPAIAKELGIAFDALLLTAPRFSATLDGEIEQLALHAGLVKLKPAGWSPPGGTNNDLQELGKVMREPSSKLSPRDEGALMLAYALEVGDVTRKACPESATYAACHRALVELAKAEVSPRTEALRDPAAYAQKLIGANDSPELREKVRLDVQRAVLDTLTAIARPPYQDYSAKRARTLYWLAAARQALLIYERKRCPKPKELESLHLQQPATAMMSVLGEPLVVKLERGGLWMEAPEWTMLGGGTGWSWRIDCK